jgi:DNA polymerase III epsilon subunit-like protein
LRFDRLFLDDMSERTGIKLNMAREIDTYQLASFAEVCNIASFPNGFSLDQLVKIMIPENERQDRSKKHDALNDAELTAQVIIKFMKLFKEKERN